MLGLPIVQGRPDGFPGHRIWGLRDRLTTNPSLPRQTRRAASLTRHLSASSRPATRASRTASRCRTSRELRLRCLLARARVGGQFRHGVQFLALHQVQPADRLVDPRPRQRLDLLAQPGQRRDRPAGHAGEVVEETRPISSCQPTPPSRPAPSRRLAPVRITSAMILITGGAGFIGSNLQAALVRRGHETVIVDNLGSAGKWRNLAKHPPSRLLPPGEIDAFLDSRPPLEMVYHLGAISDTTAVDGDAVWETNVELPRHIWHWCAEPRRAPGLCVLRGHLWRRFGRVRRRPDAVGAGQAAAAQSVRLDQARLRSPRRARHRGAAGAPAAMGRAEILQRLWARTSTTRAA